MPGILSITAVQGILISGNLDQLVGAIEHEQLEFKGEPYRLEQEQEKMELAKDVSALANTRGGIIVIGVRTERNPTHQGDEVREIRPFPQSLVDLDQYRNVLDDWVFPQIRGLMLAWYPSATDAARGVVAIIVPEEVTTDRPYVTTRALTETGRVVGSMLGYFERTFARVAPKSAAELRNLLKDGLRFSELDGRLQNIEESIGRIEAGVAERTTALTEQGVTQLQNIEESIGRIEARVAERRTGLTEQAVTQHFSEARAVLGFSGKPTFSLTSWPHEAVKFTSLFQSRTADVVHLLEFPPKLRNGGFDLSTRRASTNVRGELRRCMIPGQKLLELWRDGVLVFITQGDGWHLCWGMQSTQATGQQINNLALVETTYLFCDLVFKLYPLSSPPTETVTLQLALMDMSVDGVPCKLQPQELNQPGLYDDWRPAPASEKTVCVEVQLANSDAGDAAFRLVAQLFTWFSFDEEVVPYADRSTTSPKITPQSIGVR
jgi:hypothetical protein